MSYINRHTKSIQEIYDNYDEDTRLTRSRHGQLEYFTTMSYIERYLKPNAKILEIGAGTGRYSIELARRGYNVTAVELVESNLKVLKKNSRGIKNIKSYQGDALDLTRFKDESFDMVLVLGPMYHLYSKKDQMQAINESIRVCKKSGILMYAFLPVHSLIYGWGMEGNIKEALLENFTKDYKIKQFASQKFTGFDLDDFEALFKKSPVEKLHLVATDGIMDAEEERTSFRMDDEDFELFKKYHLATCERYELIGLSFHALYICRKK